MLVSLSRCAAAAAFSVAASLVAVPASAAPIGSGLALKNAAPAVAETVQWRGRHGGYWRGGRWWGPGVGFAAGALIGGAIAGGAPYYYGGGPYYGYAEPYDDAPPPYAGEPAYGGGGNAAYCTQRYRSYDPASGTFLGYDGRRHPCP
jgi:BA14K-like protein